MKGFDVCIQKIASGVTFQLDTATRPVERAGENRGADLYVELLSNLIRRGKNATYDGSFLVNYHIFTEPSEITSIPCCFEPC